MQLETTLVEKSTLVLALEAEVVDKATMLSALEARVVELTTQKATLEADLVDKATQMASMESSSAAAAAHTQETIAKFVGKLKELRQDLKAKTVECEGLQEEKETFQSAISLRLTALGGSLSDVYAPLTLSHHILLLTLPPSHITPPLPPPPPHTHYPPADLVEKCRALDACTQQLQDAQTTAAELDIFNKHLQQTKTQLLADKTHLFLEKKQLDEDKTHLQQELLSLEKEKDGLQQYVTRLREEIIIINDADEIKVLKEELEILEEKESFLVEINEQDEKITQLREQVAEQEAQLHAGEEQLRVVAGEGETLFASVAAATGGGKESPLHTSLAPMLCCYPHRNITPFIYPYTVYISIITPSHNTLQ